VRQGIIVRQQALVQDIKKAISQMRAVVESTDEQLGAYSGGCFRNSPAGNGSLGAAHGRLEDWRPTGAGRDNLDQ
jgi:hypothetical protein